MATGNSHHHTQQSFGFDDYYLSFMAEGFFILCERRRLELACILEEFKNRPLNQKNYIDLQRELRAAELMPEQLFGHLEGTEAQVRHNRYMSRIVQSWQKMTSRGKL